MHPKGSTSLKGKLRGTKRINVVTCRAHQDEEINERPLSSIRLITGDAVVELLISPLRAHQAR